MQIKFRYIYMLALIFSVFQFYILNFNGIVLSLYFVLSLFLLFNVVDGKINRVDIHSVSYILIIFSTFIAILWSPDIYEAIRSLVFIFIGYTLFVYTRILANNNSNFLLLCLKILCLCITIHSILVIIFYFNPSIEAVFLSSNFAKLFINNGSLALYQYDFSNNVFDPKKAGGFFLNGNSSAIMAEIGFFMTLIIGRLYKFKYYILFALINFIGIICTGSKSALFLAFFSYGISYIVFSIFFSKSNVLSKLFYSLGLFLMVLIIYLVFRMISNTEIFEDGVVNAERRKVIFEFAYNKFIDNTILGLGFGGWEREFFHYGESLKVYALSGSMPAHNYFIISWANGGLFLLISAFIFYISIIIASRKLYFREGKYIGTLFFSIFICLLFHTFVDNLLVYEEIHYAGIFGTLIAWAAYAKKIN